MDFIKAFEEIDNDNSGEITRGELIRYMRIKNYKPAFVEKWLNIFDADHSGTISLEEFCNTLGLIPNQNYKQRIEKRKSEKDLYRKKNPNNTTFDLYVIDEDPSNTEEFRNYCLQICQEATDNENDFISIAKYLKSVLDTRFNRSWNVVVDMDAYGSFLSHEPGAFIHIKVRKFAILLWKVPEEN